MADFDPSANHSPGSTLTGRTLTGLKWSGLATACHGVFSISILAVLSRLLTPADFGLVAMAMILVLLVRALGHRNVAAALIRHPMLTDRHVSAGFVLSLSCAALLAFAVWVSAPVVARFFEEPAVVPLLRVLSFSVLIESLRTVPESLWRRQMRFKMLSAIDLVAMVLGYGVVSIAFALMGLGVWALVLGIIVRATLHVAIVFWISPRLPRLRLPALETGEILRAGVGFSLAGFFHLVSWQGRSLIIGSWLGAVPLGLYNHATVLSSFFDRPAQVLDGVLFPAMSQRQQRKSRLAEIYLHGVEMLSFVAFPSSLALAICAPEIVAFLLGPQWDAVVPLVQILALGTVFQIGGLVNQSLIRALGALRQLVLRQMAYAILLVTLVVVGSRWGLGGVASATVVALAFFWFTMTQLSLSLLGLGWSDLLRRYLPALWAGLWAGPVLLFTAMSVAETNLPVALSLSLELLLCACAVAAATWYVPRFARLRFLDRGGVPTLMMESSTGLGRWLRFALTRLAHRHAR